MCVTCIESKVSIQQAVCHHDLDHRSPAHFRLQSTIQTKDIDITVPPFAEDNRSSNLSI